ncbi:WD40-repeat-containing domain protein [Dissophora ornata]|nr:WD40-repeat-containing domain protein [Dissophora ornata]
MQHSLFSAKHIQGRCGAIPWLAYYKFLHQKSLTVKRNWADAVPQAVHVLEGHTGLISSLEMSMWTLVTASIDSTLRVWDLRTLQCIRVLHSGQSLTCVSQSENANAVCARTSFGGLCIWDTRTGDLILQDDTAMPQIASFMYMDETYIGYGQCDGAVTVFDWSSRTTLEVVGSYHAHEGDVIHISILDRKYIISASTNGETLVYSLKNSCIVERILLPHATQAIQFTPTIHDDKVMFSTRDAIYEYELLLDHLASEHEQAQLYRTTNTPANASGQTAPEQHKGKQNHVQLTASQSIIPDPWRSNHITSEGSIWTEGAAAVSLRPPVSLTSRMSPTSGRVWKNSNSLLSQIRQRVGSMGRAFDQERLIIPTRFPRLASIYCLPRTCRSLDHGTTSARDSYGIFMPNHCTHLHEMSVYTRATKTIKQIHGPAVDAFLTEAIRNRFYTTMECNQHCAVVSSGSKVYVISFLPPDI